MPQRLRIDNRFGLPDVGICAPDPIYEAEAPDSLSQRVRIMKSTMMAVLGLSAAQLEPFPDPAGMFGTLSTTGRIDRRGAFFRSLGTNGRACGTCHVPQEAFGLNAAGARLVTPEQKADLVAFLTAL